MDDGTAAADAAIADREQGTATRETDAEMPLYEGTKKLRARPMTKGEYNRFRGWEHPADEDANEAGYLVEYVDGGKANVAGFDGYVSWSPANVFEAHYHRLDETVPSTSDERTVNNVLRHEYRVLDDDEKAAMQAVKDCGQEFLKTLHNVCRESRETSLARTKIEEAVMWAVKGITA
jgi:hypothetical protein